MSSELESRLERALAAIAPPSAESHDRARRAALDALGTIPPRGRRFALPLLAAAALTAVLVTAGVTLAASGTVTIPLVQKPAPKPRPAAQVTHHPSPLPPGSAALAIEIGGRRWSATAHGVRSHPGTLSAMALSPGALYRLEAQGHRLRAVGQSTGRVAFSRRVAGTVVAAAWSPLPIRIAYLERVGSSIRLHDMWGTGTHDRMTALPAAGVTPTWRWDSLAAAFVRANGRVATLDATTGAVATLPRACSISRALAVAYSPSNDLLAIAGNHRLAVVDPSGAAPPRCISHAWGEPSLAWIGGRRLATGAGSKLMITTLSWGGASSQTTPFGTRVTALAAAPQGHRLLMALDEPNGTEVVPVTAGRKTAPPLFTIAGHHGPTAIQWR